LENQVNGTGELPGLTQAIIDSLRNYKTSPAGICYLSSDLQVTLPYADWATYSWFEVGTETYAIAATNPQVIFTVPTNERVYLDCITVRRTSGDNLMNLIRLINPVGYGSGDRTVDLLSLSSSAANMWWPDMGGVQGLNWIANPGPILLEPGATVALDPNGSGVAETLFHWEMVLRRCKLSRQLVP